MAGTFRVTYEMKKAFFDREKIKRALDRQQRRSISKSLAFVRTRARSLLRRRKRPAAAGRPPSVHSSGPGLKTILFAYDTRIKGGIVGPVKLNQVNITDLGTKTVPSILEFGSQVRIHETQSFTDGKWYRRDRRRKLGIGQKRRVRSVQYQPRPFMTPALETEAKNGNILSPWANVLGN